MNIQSIVNVQTGHRWAKRTKKNQIKSNKIKIDAASCGGKNESETEQIPHLSLSVVLLCSGAASPLGFIKSSKNIPRTRPEGKRGNVIHKLWYFFDSKKNGERCRRTVRTSAERHGFCLRCWSFLQTLEDYSGKDSGAGSLRGKWSCLTTASVKNKINLFWRGKKTRKQTSSTVQCAPELHFASGP